MGYNLKENEEDISDTDDIFEDNKDNIDKFPNADRSSATDSNLVIEEDEGPRRDTIEEEGEIGEEIRGEAEGGQEEESDMNTRTVTTTAPTTANPSTNESEGATSTSVSPLL